MGNQATRRPRRGKGLINPDGAASDIHLKVGTPVIFRINRQLIAIECPYPSEEWMNKVVDQVAPAHLKRRLEHERERVPGHMRHVGLHRTFPRAKGGATPFTYRTAAVPPAQISCLLPST